MSELVWTTGAVSIIGLHPSGRLNVSILKPSDPHRSEPHRKNWMWQLTYDIPGKWDCQSVKLSAIGWGRTEKEAIQRASDWYDRLPTGAPPCADGNLPNDPEK